jgi:hypothetical protein
MEERQDWKVVTLFPFPRREREEELVHLLPHKRTQNTEKEGTFDLLLSSSSLRF